MSLLRHSVRFAFSCKQLSSTYETWKQCQRIMRTLTCKHKIWGENLLYLRPYLKAFHVFNVLETCRVYFLTIDLGIVKFIKQNLSRGFLNNAKFVGMDQITCKNCNKSSWMQVNNILLTRDRPEQFPFFLYRVFNEIKPLWDEAALPKLTIFLNY